MSDLVTVVAKAYCAVRYDAKRWEALHEIANDLSAGAGARQHAREDIAEMLEVARRVVPWRVTPRCLRARNTVHRLE